MGTAPWFHKLNVDSMRIKGLHRRSSSKQLLPPRGRGFCGDISIRPRSYMRSFSDYSATILMPAITKLVNSNSCLPATGGCRNSVVQVLKPKRSKQLSGNDSRTLSNLQHCEDEKIETPHPSSPNRAGPLGAHRPAAATVHYLYTLSNSRATSPGSSFEKSGADKYRYSKKNSRSIKENCAADDDAGEKDVVLTKMIKQSRHLSTASGRTSARRRFKQQTGIPDSYNSTKTNGQADAFDNYNDAKTKGSKSKPKVTFGMANKMQKADSRVPTLLLPAAHHDGNSLVYGTAIMSTDPYFSRFDGHSSTSSLTSDDNMFSSFEQNLVIHSSRSSSTDRLQEMVRCHESQPVKTHKSKHEKKHHSSGNGRKGGLILDSDEPWQLMSHSSLGSVRRQADIVKMRDAEKENAMIYQSPSTHRALSVGDHFKVINAKETAITYHSLSSQRDLQSKMTNTAAPIKSGSLKNDTKSNVKLLQTKNSAISVDANKAQLLLDLGGGGGHGGSTATAGWMSCGGSNNAKTWRINSSNHTSAGAAAGTAVQKKAQLLQARWELTETPFVWVDSGDDDAASSASCLTPENFHQPPRHSIFARLGNNHVVTATPGATARAASEDPPALGAREQSMISTAYLTNQSNSTVEQDPVHSDGLPMTKDEAVEREVAEHSSVAVVKCSKDPFVDFRDSMVDMMVERQIQSVPAMEELLQCFLALNKPEHHPTIIRAFTHVWKQTFQDLDMTGIKSPISSHGPSPWKGLSPNYYTM